MQVFTAGGALPDGVLVDAEDLEPLSATRWYVGTNGYVMTRSGEYMHRIIMAAGPGQIVDHVNGSRRDNRRLNLRFSSTAENNANRRVLGSKNRSGYRGVSFCNQTGRWKATAKIAYRQRWVGRFATPQEAHAAVSAFRLANMPGATA